MKNPILFSYELYLRNILNKKKRSYISIKLLYASWKEASPAIQLAMLVMLTGAQISNLPAVVQVQALMKPADVTKCILRNKEHHQIRLNSKETGHFQYKAGPGQVNRTVPPTAPLVYLRITYLSPVFTRLYQSSGSTSSTKHCACSK